MSYPTDDRSPRFDAPVFEAMEPRVMLSAAGFGGEAWGDSARPAHDAILAPEPSNTSDVDGDGDNDLIFRADRFGGIAYLELEQGEAVGTVAMQRFDDPAWSLVGVADFDGEHHADLLFHNPTTRQFRIWFMDGRDMLSSSDFAAPAAFEVAGVGDFTGDAIADIALINRATGRIVIWKMSLGGPAEGGATVLPQRLGNRNWHAVGAGDVDADGDADLLFRNTRTGQNVIWHMNGTTVAGSSFAPPLRGSVWQVGEVKDFNGDGHADIAWRNNITNQNAIWILGDSGATRVSSTIVPGFANREWSLPYHEPPRIVPADPWHRPPTVAIDDEADRRDVDLLLGLEPVVAFPGV